MGAATTAIHTPIKQVRSDEGVENVWTANHPSRGMCVVTPFFGKNFKDNRMWCALINGTDQKYGLHREFLKAHVNGDVVFWELPAEPCFVQIGQKGISGSGIYYYANPKGDLEHADVADILLIMRSIDRVNQDSLPESQPDLIAESMQS